MPVSSLILSSKCYKYADDVLSGKIKMGVKVQQACERFITDLDNMGKKGHPWEFDIQKAYRPIDFIERFCKPSKGDYERMELMGWQHFIEGNMYGWVDKKTGLRRFRESIIIVGSGNGKSTLISGNATYGASKDGERGAEIYLLANSKEQAGIIFGECKAQIEASPILKKEFRPLRNTIHFDRTKSIIKALATDSKTLDGLNVYKAIFDEIQDYRNYDLINRIKPKTKKRQQPLIIYITTLGTVTDGPLMDLYIMAEKILSKDSAIAQRAADRVFAYVAEIDENDDPNDTECWIKANPSLGVILKMEDMIDEWERAKLVPAERSNFINRQLNVFTEVDELSFLDPKTIEKNNKEVDIESLAGERCYGGFDLAETEDFTSACIEFPLPENEFFVLSHTWVPYKKMQMDKEKLDWQNLVAEGYLTIVDGEYVDYNLVFEWFQQQREKYNLVSIGYDPAKAYMLVQELQKHGYDMQAVRQGELTLTAPMDNLKERFLDGKVIHNKNKMFKWYLGNVKLTKRGHNATYLPTKRNAYRKIDGFAAFLNAHTEYLRKNPVYIPEDKELVTVIDLGGL